MIKIPLTKGYTALIDDEDAHLADEKWCAAVRAGTVYAHRNFRSDGGRQSNVRLHREVLGLQPGDGKIVDHINGDGLDCRRANLRIVTREENQRNLGGPHVYGSSGFLGVHRSGSCWAARIRADGKDLYLGVFHTPEEANLARLVAERDIWGIQPRRRAAFEQAGVI